MNNFNYEFIDIRLIRWGYPPAPLLPMSLRNAWRDVELPTWVCNELGLPHSSTMEKLDPTAWNNLDELSDRLRHFLLFLVRTRSKSVEKIRCIERAWPIGLKVGDVAWSTRTINSLARNDLLGNEQELAQITFGELFKVEGMGAMTVLDFCSTLEGAIDAHEALSMQYTKNPSQPQYTNYSEDIAGLAEEKWTYQISKKDPRFSDLIDVSEGTIQDQLEEILTNPDTLSNVSFLPLLISSIGKIRSRMAEIEKQPLEDCLADLLKRLSRSSGDRLSALIARFGWNGDHPLTLEESGQILGVTRERIRQIQNKVIRRLPEHEIFMPGLDKALSLLEENAPITLPDASSLILSAGITQNKFDLEALFETVKLFKKSTTLQISESRTGKMLVNKPHANILGKIHSIARKLAGQSGVSSIYQVQDSLLSNGEEIDIESLKKLLLANKELEFLDEDWFWATTISNSRNRLRNTVRKILCVTSPQTLLSIRDGVRRTYRWRISTNSRFATLTVPPINIMQKFLSRHPEFSVEGDLVQPTIPLDYTKELGDTDRIMVEVLRSSPAGILDRESFADNCLQRGMNENTFSIYSSYSCVIEHVGINIWKLRGTHVDPAAVEAMRIANHLRPREKRVLQYGWSADGKLWIAARIPRIGKNSMVVGCPGSIQRYLLNRDFTCLGKDSRQPCGTISINSTGSSYGYGVFIRKYGLDENDVLLAEFELASNTVELSLSDDEIFDESNESP